jgi:hypothetical protein
MQMMTSPPDHRDQVNISRCAYLLLLRMLIPWMACPALLQLLHLPQTRVKFNSLLQPESKIQLLQLFTPPQTRVEVNHPIHTFQSCSVVRWRISAGAGCNALCTTSLAQCALHDIAGAMRSARHRWRNALCTTSLAQYALHDIGWRNALCTAMGAGCVGGTDHECILLRS